ncbi:MAG: hypothetical protein KKC19_02410, partial [Nanoarchaeota archaeon]|nr:hypothetical protein [Nanoarchaeota archaeon]
TGIYLPRNQTAVVQEDNTLSLFHEYFGHGLYCEQSLTGIKLVDLEKSLLDEEKQKFQDKQFTLKELQEFRQGNRTFQKLEHRDLDTFNLLKALVGWRRSWNDFVSFF